MSEIEQDEFVYAARVSSMPICGLYDAIKRIEKPPRPRPYSMDFYTAVGTAVHETLQQRMARSKRWGKIIFGNWLCDNRECKHVLPLQLRPKHLVCPKCTEGRLRYDEISFEQEGVSGHLDMLTQHKKKHRKKKRRKSLVCAWEFKTTNENSLRYPRYLPYGKHHVQIETYCLMLKELYGIEVDYYFIVYISRNKTQMSLEETPHFLPFPFKVTASMLARRKTQLVRVQKSKRAADRLLASPTRKRLHRLENLRACHSSQDYFDPNTGMKLAFFGKEHCEFFKSGSCFKQGRTEPGKRLAKLLGIRK